MAKVVYMSLPFLSELHKTTTSSSSSSSSKPLKLPHRTRTTNISISSSTNGSANRSVKPQKFNSDISPHRAVSAVRLMRIELGGAFADLLNEKGKGSGENEMGYVQRTLGFRTRELNNQDLRLILRIGVFEIVKLDMPPYAVVDENVQLAKAALRPGAGNMVNGILRKLVVLKEKEMLPLPKVEGNDRSQARALATLYSHPVWIVRRWTKYLGQEETIKLMIWNNSEPSFSLRLVPHKLSLHLDDFVRIKTGLQTIIHAGLLKKGLCSVQDESAGLVVSIVDPQPGDTIVDCCAAPGGKTLYMASHLSGQGMVYAVDINSGRLRILKETAKLHQVDGVVTTVHADLRILTDGEPLKSNKVLLDAPCSGLGVLSKRADLRWNRDLADMEQLKNLQDELLDAASTLVKPGGVLVYSTCSIDPEENDERVAAFLVRHPDFHIDPVDRYVPPDFVTPNGFYFSNPQAIPEDDELMKLKTSTYVTLAFGIKVFCSSIEVLEVLCSAD
ncbi:hypothetical protein TSUD_256320 [Trifolium subterraneum]|uniref:SAM-dependent MTase RsmB/NOP-type domain-containing protein n=1 Tax=Trifolium subterraneum TaxID=3900 RepID=A0A2Z6M794_TRISU|nr:hypothetical protein TSUD_256320 [Trifolium subterraneum]